MRVRSGFLILLSLSLALALVPSAAAGQRRAAPHVPRYSPSRYRAEAPTVRVRLLVSPKTARVYLDGYYAGTVDGFDGFFQGLDVTPGHHVLVLYLEGYQTVRETLAVRRGTGYKLRYTMKKLAKGETSEPPPSPPEPTPAEEPSPRPAAPSATPVAATSPNGSAFGTLTIDVQPAGAEVRIDGTRWPAPGGNRPLVVQVGAGPHVIEVRKDGYQPFSRKVQVRAGVTTPLNISLPPIEH